MKTFVEGKVACGLGDGAQKVTGSPSSVTLTWLGLQPGAMVGRDITRVLCCLKYGSFLGIEAFLCKALGVIFALGAVGNFHSTAIALTRF